jgi:hypothetical protein
LYKFPKLHNPQETFTHHTKVQACFFNLAKIAALSVWAAIEKNLAGCAISTYYYNLLNPKVTLTK